MTITQEEEKVERVRLFPNPQHGPLGYQPAERIVEPEVDDDDEDTDWGDDGEDDDDDL